MKFAHKLTLALLVVDRCCWAPNRLDADIPHRAFTHFE